MSTPPPPTSLETPQVLSLPRPASPARLDPPDSGPNAPGRLTPNFSGRRRPNGKIPHLPREHIERINHLLDQGHSYREILVHMAAAGVNLTCNNLTNWYRGGYQDHLKVLETRRLVLQLQERLLEFAASGKGPTLANVSLQVSVTRLANMILELAPGPHVQTFQNDAREYLRLVNTLAHLTKSQLAVQQYEDERAASQAATLPPRDPSRELTDREMDLVATNLDKVFRRRRPTRLPGSFAPPAEPAPDDAGL